MTVQEMKNADIRFADKSQLVDLRELMAGGGKSISLETLLKKTPNLYQYRVGEIAVAFDYLEDGGSINDAFLLMVQASS